MEPASDYVVSVVSSATDTACADSTVSAIVARIRSLELAEATAAVRLAYSAGGKVAAGAPKRALPAAIFSGVFGRRSGEAMQQASGLMVADLDEVDAKSMAELRSRLASDPAALVVFTSPTGSGLKVVVRTGVDDTSAASHARAFAAVRRWLRKSHGIELDESGKDRARLCFLAHDPAVIHNPQAIALDARWCQNDTESATNSNMLRMPNRIQGNNVERARRHLMTLPASVEGDHGHNALFRAATAMAWGFDLAEAEAMTLMQEYNTRAVPPWNVADLARKLHEAYTQPHREPRGWLLDGKGAETANVVPPEWPEPTPLPSGVVPMVPDLGAMIPDRLRPMAQYVAAAAEALQAPQESALALSVAIAAFAGGRAWEVETVTGHREPLALWVAALDLPGTKKTGLLHTLAKPLHDWLANEHRILAGPLAIYREQREAMQARRSSLRAMVAKAKPGTDTSGMIREAQALAVELESMPELHRPSPLVTEATSEGIRDALERDGEKCLLLASEADAFDVLMGRYSKDGTPSLGLVCSAWSGEPITVGRVGRVITLDRPFLGAALYVQPEGAAAFLGSGHARGRGAVDRLWLISARTRRGDRNMDPPAIPAELSAWWNERIGGLMDRPWLGRTCAGADGAVRSDKRPVILTLAPEARTLWMSWRSANESRLKPETGDLEACAGFADKLGGTLARLAAVFAILDNREALTVDGECMAAALAWGQWLLDHHRAVMGDLSAPPALRVAHRLLASLKRSPSESLTGRDAMRRLGGGSSPDAPDMEAVLSACGELEERGWLKPVSGAVSGRPGRPAADRWLIHPALAQRIQAA
jgi:hypothetical protein